MVRVKICGITNDSLTATQQTDEPLENGERKVSPYRNPSCFFLAVRAFLEVIRGTFAIVQRIT